MLKIKENKNLKKLESPIQEINEDWKKYNKRLDSMLDNAHFSNELDTKKVRVKNPKLAVISLVSLALIILIFVQNKKSLNLSQSIVNEQTSDKTKLLVTEDALAKNSTEKIESKQNQPNNKRNKTSKKNQILKTNEGRINSLKEKPSSIRQAKTKKQITPSNGKFYFIQVGAFSIKDNAIKLAKKLNSKGFQTEISVGKIKLSKFQVFSGNFTDKDDTALRLKKLKSLGFLPLIKKNKNTHIIELGLFSKKQKATSLADKLKTKGIKSDIKLVEANREIYIVLAKNLTTERKAQQARKMLINLGFKNSFIRYQQAPKFSPTKNLLK